MAGLECCDCCRSGMQARMRSGRLRGMDLSVGRHAVHGATTSNSPSNRFAHLGVHGTWERPSSAISPRA